MPEPGPRRTLSLSPAVRPPGRTIRQDTSRRPRLRQGGRRAPRARPRYRPPSGPPARGRGRPPPPRSVPRAPLPPKSSKGSSSGKPLPDARPPPACPPSVRPPDLSFRPVPGREGRRAAPDAPLRSFPSLLLLLHDPGERGVARLIQPQVGRDHRRQRHPDRLEAPVHLAGDVRLLPVLRELDLLPQRRLRQGENRRQDLPPLVVVVVDGLLPHDDEVRLLLLHRLRHQPGDAQTVQFLRRLHEDSTVRPPCRGGSDLLLALLRADRQDHHLPAPLLPDPAALPHPDPSSRVDHHLDVLQDDSAPV